MNKNFRIKRYILLLILSFSIFSLSGCKSSEQREKEQRQMKAYDGISDEVYDFISAYSNYESVLERYNKYLELTEEKELSFEDEETIREMKLNIERYESDTKTQFNLLSLSYGFCSKEQKEQIVEDYKDRLSESQKEKIYNFFISIDKSTSDFCEIFSYTP